MPGLSQLKQFNADLLNLGDEVKIRSARGEKPVSVPIPKKIPDVDDSEDFVNGMPQISEEELEQADAAAAEMEKAAHDFSDITGESSGDEGATASSFASTQKVPDVKDLLAPPPDLSLSDLDLSEFEEPAQETPVEEEEEEEIPLEDMDLDSLLASGDTEPEEEVQAPAESEQRYVRPSATKPKVEVHAENSEDVDMDDFLSTNAKSAVSNTVAEEPAKPALEPAKEDLFAGLPSFDIDEENKNFPSDNAVNMNDGIPTEFNEVPGNGTLSTITKPETPPKTVEQSAPEFEEISTDDIFAQPVEKPVSAPLASPSFDTSDMPLDEETAFESERIMDNLPMSQEMDGADESGTDLFTSFGSDSDDSAGTSPSDMGGLDLPVFDGDTLDSGSKTISQDTETSAQDGDAKGFDLGDLDLPDFGDDASAGADDSSLSSDEVLPPPADFTADAATGSDGGQTISSGDGLDLPDFGADGSASDGAFAGAEDSGAAEESGPAEMFDTSGMDDLDDTDFSKKGEDTGFELGDITDSEGGDDEFSIPGFSDTKEADLGKKKKPLLSSSSSSEEEEDASKKPKNSFTDAEYRLFQKNLAEYPLNVRIALEDIVVKNELTDDALFSVLEMVLRKVPARQLAGQLEKMLDIQLDVPRDFELRTAAEYEAYKQSVEYKLKNQIIPGAILTAIAAIFIFCIFMVVKTFVVMPLWANSLYKEGYSLLEREQYPQSLVKFNEAIDKKPVKKWFFKYAQGYREHKQFGSAELPSDRRRKSPLFNPNASANDGDNSLGPNASTMYRAILERFDHDKQAGIEWADMEADLFHWERAERILTREVLDYHINDPDAILALGDLYLEWADSDIEGNVEKFPEAKKQYDLLVELYGEDDKLYDRYSARQMRYFIRTDDLATVLTYKDYFYPKKMKYVENSDVTELGGYLFDKRYGELRPSEENLRSQIENVKPILTLAVERDGSDPVALYNLARYYVQTKSNSSARVTCESAINAFKEKKSLKRKDTYKYINTYRILGEMYGGEKQYIQAQKAYISGIELFESNKELNAYTGNKDIGMLYADLGDIFYFKDGNADNAFENYAKAIENNNDIPSIRYKMGYIQYNKKNYQEALTSLMVGSEAAPSDTHMLLALANTLWNRSDFYAARGYYDKLLDILEEKRQGYKIVLPQIREDHGDFVDTYMKASNNLGATLSRIANMTGNSEMNGQAIVALQDSLRAWDALSRNQDTMVRLDSSNLAEQNVKYITRPDSEYSPEIYTKIPMLMDGEEGLE
ncbi:MAG: hypothetical protein K6E22_11215 [Treponema sp.]|nr:hypothetical protein [Treponema sp.]